MRFLQHRLLNLPRSGWGQHSFFNQVFERANQHRGTHLPRDEIMDGALGGPQHAATQNDLPQRHRSTPARTLQGLPPLDNLLPRQPQEFGKEAGPKERRWGTGEGKAPQLTLPS